MNRSVLGNYSCWYTHTYDAILQMANWDVFASDAEKKIVCVFSWMPQTIMAVKHKGGRQKKDVYDLRTVSRVMEEAQSSFDSIKHLELMTVDLLDVKTQIRGVCSKLFRLFGSVVASKYLHFSVPRLLPMWDSAIRNERHYKDTPDGYFDYIQQFQNDLAKNENFSRAVAVYPNNPVRGWDIVNMTSRRSGPNHAQGVTHARTERAKRLVSARNGRAREKSKRGRNTD